MEDKKNENEFLFYVVDVETQENQEDKKQEVEQKEESNISIEKNTDDRLNKFIYDIFVGCNKYDENGRYYVINNLQMNLIINEIEWHEKFTECILKEEVELQSREVLLLYQVFVTRILYMILMNHGDNLNGYNLKLKFDALCDEFVKAIPDFKTNDDVLNFLFDKMLDTKNCVDKNKDDNDIGQMKQEILDCVDSLLENENNDDSEVYNFQIDDKKKIVKTNSCCIISYENKIYDLKKYYFHIEESNVNNSYDFENHDFQIDESDKDENYENKSCKDEEDELEFGFKNEKTKWSKDLGKEISLRQTEEIKTPNDTNYSKLEKIGDLLKNNYNHRSAIEIRTATEEMKNKTPISYKTLLSYLDKKNKDADKNFEAILNYYNQHELDWKYLKPIIQIGIRSFKEIFMPNSVLKEYWTQKKFPESTEDNFDDLLYTLKTLRFNINYQDFGIFKYKDEDGNFYTHSLVLENLGDFCYEKQIVDHCELGDEYTKITHEIKVKPEYENDFKNIKIKPNTFYRRDLIDCLKKDFIFWYDNKRYEKDILNEKYHQCLKLIPISQLLKTKIYDNTDVNYLCDFDMLNDINDKCENVEQMAKQIIKEAMRKNNAIKMDENNQLDSGDFNNLDEEEKDDYIRKTHSYHSYYYNIFEGKNLFEIISKKLKDRMIKIRSDNHEVIKAIFKTFKYKFGDCGVNENKKNYFSQCCDLVKELCVEYENEKEFITYELFGTMLDHITDWFCRDIDIKDYATILFQLGESSGKKSYKFTTDQQIGFLRCYLDKLNNANEKNKNSIRYRVPRIFEIIIQQHNEVKLDQKVIDYLFLTINDAECLDILLREINDAKYNFSLSLNVVERMFDLFIKAEDKNYLYSFVSCIILNDNINFISDDKKQDDEIKDLKEEQRQKVIDYLFLTINDAECLNNLLGEIRFQKYNFSLSLNVVERMFDLFIKAKHEDYLQNLVSCIILNDNINFISDDKKQDDEIKDAKEEQRQIRLNFIKMYLEKIKGNKELLNIYALNSVFKYFDDNLETKKEIANKIIDCDFRFDRNERSEILYETQKDDQEELEEILSKWEKEEKKESEIKTEEQKEKKEIEEKTENEETHKNQHDNTEMNQNGELNMITDNSIKNEIKTTELKTDLQKDIELTDSTQKESESKISKIEKEEKKEEEDKNSYKKADSISDGDISTNKMNSKNIASIKNEIKTTESQIYPQKDISPTEQTQKESFFNRSIYFAIALIIIVVILTFVFKEPLILSALLAPIIIFVYRFIQRCKKNNPEQKKPNLKTNDSPQQKSISAITQNINLMVNKQGEKIILDGNTNVQSYINNLN